MRYWRAFARPWAALHRPDDGSAAVELAVVLPVLLLLVMGVVDFGHVFVTSIAVASAAKAGAQYGAQSTVTSGDTAKINAAARLDYTSPGFDTLRVTSQRQCRCPATGETVLGSCACTGGVAPRVFVEVTTRDSVSLLFRYPGFPAKVPVVQTATLRVQ